MNQIRRLVKPVPERDLPRLDHQYRSTFQRGTCWPGLLPRGEKVYRYGSTPQQASGSRQDWVNLSEDLVETSEEVIQNLCLLDFTGSDLGERDSKTGASLAAVQAAPGWKPSAGKSPEAWNTAAWRGVFEAEQDVYVWAGAAGPMAFDVFTGKRYLGRGDQMPHISRPGGGSQVLVHGSVISRLRLIQTVPLARVKYLI